MRRGSLGNRGEAVGNGMGITNFGIDKEAVVGGGEGVIHRSKTERDGLDGGDRWRLLGCLYGKVISSKTI